MFSENGCKKAIGMYVQLNGDFHFHFVDLRNN